MTLSGLNTESTGNQTDVAKSIPGFFIGNDLYNVALTTPHVFKDGLTLSPAGETLICQPTISRFEDNLKIGFEEPTNVFSPIPTFGVFSRPRIVATNALPKSFLENIEDLRKLKDLNLEFLKEILRLFSTFTKVISEEKFGSILKDFLRFVFETQSYKNIPEFSIAPNGMLVVEWYKNSKNRLDIEFVGENICLFGLYNKGFLIEGYQSISGISSILKGIPEKPLSW